MASSSYLSLLFLASLICTAIPLSASSRAVPAHADGGADKAVYTKVCDAARFKAAGLDMSRYRYCNASLPYADRVRDLIGWMTVEEKVGNLGDWAAGAPRVGLPSYKWWSEALHGLSSTGPTTKFDDPKTPRLHSGRAAVFNGTVFANVINSAASFNESLWKSIGQAISTEARAMYNLGKGGLTYWSPNINVVRDPRWGRALETPGEDPYVVGRYAVNFVRGMQDIPGHETVSAGGDPLSRPLKTSACCKPRTIRSNAGPPCRYVTPHEGISKDVKISQHANVTIYFGGINLHIEREGNDREDLLLPKNQTEEIIHLAAASPHPIVLVILSGGGIDISFAQNNPKIGAILWAGYPGGEGGHAIADVIFGRYNPGGRLPLTWFKEKYIHQIPMTSMELRPRPDHGYPGRTYKFYDGPEVLYPFGHGLSYTKFLYEISANGTAVTLDTAGRHCKRLSYKAGAVDAAPACPAINVDGHACAETIGFNVSVINSGDVDGTHAMLVYTVPPPEVAGAPIKQVVAFQRVSVRAGSTSTARFTLNVCKAFGIVEKTAYTVVPSGVSTVLIENGDSSAPSSVSFPVKINFSA